MRSDMTSDDIACMALTGVTATFALAETIFVLVLVISFKDSPPKLHESRITIVNVALFLGCFSTACMSALFMLSILMYHSSRHPSVFTVLEDVCFALMQSTYLIFAWNRTQALAKNQSPILFRRLMLAVKIIPGFCFLSIIPITMSVINIPNPEISRVYFYAFMISCGASGTCVLAFDLALLVVFQRFLTQNYGADETPSQEFIIVAHYGRISSIFCIVVGIVYAAALSLGPDHPLFNVLISVCYVFMNIVWVSLIFMKLEIKRFQTDKESTRDVEKDLVQIAMSSLGELDASNTINKNVLVSSVCRSHHLPIQ